LLLGRRPLHPPKKPTIYPPPSPFIAIHHVHLHIHLQVEATLPSSAPSALSASIVPFSSLIIESALAILYQNPPAHFLGLRFLWVHFELRTSLNTSIAA
jgi:hypothetical protein